MPAIKSSGGRSVAAIIFAAIILAALPAAVSAQWPDYPARGVPRTPDGKPNLTAAPPKAADGHTDLSGIWLNTTKPAVPQPALAESADSGGFGNERFSRTPFGNVGVMVQGGLPFQPWALALRQSRMAENNKDNPDAHCLPLGLMQFHLHPQPRKIVQTPGLTLILYEAQAGIRQIFTDGRPLPKNPPAWWYGYSIGKWDGDTFVVETTGFRDDVWLDVQGSPLTGAGKTTERFRRVDYGHLEIDVTVDDPKAYTKPWTVKLTQTIMPDTDLIEFICGENEKDAPHLIGK
jgi:hypothetical protein